jgi:hypothetical protein
LHFLEIAGAVIIIISSTRSNTNGSKPRHPCAHVSAEHARRFECRFGAITLRRTRGYCRKCGKWCFPADFFLGLEETAGYSPRVQEMAALLASKMPVSEASGVLEHLTGVKMPRPTLDREARRQGQRDRELRRKNWRNMVLRVKFAC